MWYHYSMGAAKVTGKKLLEKLRPLFWSYDFDSLHTERHKRVVIIQVINYGSWSDWKWLARTYGKEELRRMIERMPVTEFRPGALTLISLLLNIKKTRDVF